MMNTNSKIKKFVIPAFIAGTHLSAGERVERWVAGTSPAMTKNKEVQLC